MYSDAKEANSHARGKQEEHRLAKKQLSETKTRRSPLQSQHWTPENYSALILSHLETEGELPKFIVSENMKHVFLSVKSCVMWKHWGVLSVIHDRNIPIPFLTLHYCWGEGLLAAKSLGWAGVFGASNPISCLDQVQWEQAAQSLTWPVFNISKVGDVTTPLVHLF